MVVGILTFGIVVGILIVFSSFFWVVSLLIKISVDLINWLWKSSVINIIVEESKNVVGIFSHL